MSDRLRICVLTGDPRLPDPTKRDRRYNEEDFATQRTMRQAFEALPGFRFEFLNDHGALLERFSRDAPDLVVNFCDTGFQNVPAQELHVPALLEMLGVPYSGASPACMASATTSRSCVWWRRRRACRCRGRSASRRMSPCPTAPTSIRR